MYVDAHIHLHEFEENELKILLRKKEFILLAVSDDVISSLKTLKLGMLYEKVIPAVGIHPWNAHKVSKEDLEKIKEIVDKYNIKVLGEIGLDKKFVPHTFEKQLEIFKFFLELAREYDLSLNLHSPEAWREVFDLLLKYDIKNAYFHWYTGPLDLLEEIQKQGYFVGINVAIFIQEKHQKVLENVDLNNILTESDGPYQYRGLFLYPEKIKDLVNYISEKKKIEKEKVIERIRYNLARFLS